MFEQLRDRDSLPGQDSFVEILTRGGIETFKRNRRANWNRLERAVFDATRFIENSDRRDATLTEIYERRNREIHSLTGVQLDNPMRPEFDPLDRAADAIAKRDAARRNWQARVDELARQHAEHADVIGSARDIEADVHALVRSTEIELLQASATDLSAADRLTAVLSGGFAGAFRDPLQVGALFVGGGPGRAITAIGRMGKVMLTEALINSGLEGVLQLGARQWRAEHGLDTSLGGSLAQVGIAGLFGATAGAALQGAREVARVLKVTDPQAKRAIERVLTDEAKPGDLQQVAGALGVELSDAEIRIARVAEEQAALDQAAASELAGVTAQEQAELLAAATRRAEDPDAPEPDGVPVKPERPADVDQVVDENLEPKQRFTVQDRPVTFRQFDPDALEVDPATYQYKADGDEFGITDRLRDVREWDPTASGKIIVHERGGRLYVADGHQRAGLARRLKEDGDSTIEIDGYLFRERDGWKVEQVRALAAKKNMQEGSGTALDAARILRDQPEILDNALPVSGPMMKRAVALARLADDAFRMVTNGLAEQHHGAAVGRLVADPRQQVAVLAEVARNAPETERMTDLMVREILAAGFSRETQSDMFGELAVTRSLMAERVQILDKALQVLRRDKTLFSQLADNAELLEAAGNVLDTAGNTSRVSAAETVMGLIDRLARARGPVSDALTAAAERFAGGAPAASQARQFVADVGELLDRRGVRGLVDAPEPERLAPSAHVEPASPDAERLAELARIEAPRLDDGEQSLWDVLPDGQDGLGNTRFTTVETEIGKADALDAAADLIAACKD